MYGYLVMDFGQPGDIRYEIIGRKDGVVRICTAAWTDGRKTFLGFSSPDSPVRPLLLFDTEKQAREWLVCWQRSFPADAQGWDMTIEEFEV